MNREKHWDSITGRGRLPRSGGISPSPAFPGADPAGRPRARCTCHGCRRRGLDAGRWVARCRVRRHHGPRPVSGSSGRAKERLGRCTAQVKWIVGDVLDPPVPTASCGVWHDRAVFHFLLLRAHPRHRVGMGLHLRHHCGFPIPGMSAFLLLSIGIPLCESAGQGVR
jgi:hypothetical protein